MPSFDYLVVGGGIAGLTFAIEAARYGTVAVLFKKNTDQSSTAWAQGGVAAVTTADDNFELHIEDTLKAGAGLCHRDVVEIVVREGPQRVAELIERGAKFDKEDGSSSFHLHKEGGHSRRRIFHAADATGHEIQQVLLNAASSEPNIHFFDHSNAIDLITTHKLKINTLEPNRVVGAYILRKDGEIEAFLSSKILLATGGAGKIYLYTSNPDVATGDGIAMSYRAGARVSNLEFFQFHPTCLYHPKAKNFLITEAMRGEGAVLLRRNGDRFMPRYHELAELAPRDVVARAIDSEMKMHGDEYVLLDISHKGPEFVQQHFPTIYSKCKEFGFDIGRDPIPVVPAAHYCCGGVLCDTQGRTDIDGLYVAGECSCTGLHGANRLASNSLLEGMVYGHRAAVHATQVYRPSTEAIIPPPWDPGDSVESDEQVVITQNWDEIRRCMWNYVGIVRSTKRLERALRRIEVINQEIAEYYSKSRVTSDLLELRNLCLVAELVVKCAMTRKESRGLHYTIDYPYSRATASDVVLGR